MVTDLLSLAYFSVRIKYVIHIPYKYVNGLFMLPLRLLVSHRLLVVKFLGLRYHAHILIAYGMSTSYPHIFQGLTVYNIEPLCSSSEINKYNFMSVMPRLKYSYIELSISLFHTFNSLNPAPWKGSPNKSPTLPPKKSWGTDKCGSMDAPQDCDAGGRSRRRRTLCRDPLQGPSARAHAHEAHSHRGGMPGAGGAVSTRSVAYVPKSHT